MLFVIRVILTRSHRYTLGEVMQDPKAPSIELVTYDQLIRSARVKTATYIFTDFDRLSASDLELAALLYLQLKNAGMNVFNNPAIVKKRFALLRALHDAGLNDFNVYRAEELPSSMRFPVYIRKMNGHSVPCTGLLDGRGEVEKALQHEIDSGNPLEYLMVIEFAGETVQPGIYRKLATHRFGSIMAPIICGHDTTWLVKQGRVGIAGEDLYQDEAKIVRENLYTDYLQKVFELAKIDYGRADYGFYKGRIQVFEINTNPHIFSPGPHPFPTRVKTMKLSWTKTISAFHAIDSAPGKTIHLPKNKKLDRHRKWRSYFRRTRALE